MAILALKVTTPSTAATVKTTCLARGETTYYRVTTVAMSSTVVVATTPYLEAGVKIPLSSLRVREPIPSPTLVTMMLSDYLEVLAITTLPLAVAILSLVAKP